MDCNHSTQKETRERLLNTVKKEVKQLMEFSVSCKFVHEDNCCITSLCGKTKLVNTNKFISINYFIYFFFNF